MASYDFRKRCRFCYMLILFSMCACGYCALPACVQVPYISCAGALADVQQVPPDQGERCEICVYSHMTRHPATLVDDKRSLCGRGIQLTHQTGCLCMHESRSDYELRLAAVMTIAKRGMLPVCESACSTLSLCACKLNTLSDAPRDDVQVLAWIGSMPRMAVVTTAASRRSWSQCDACKETHPV